MLKSLTSMFYLILACSVGNTAELKVKHGLWTAQVELTGLPIAVPPKQITYCVDKDNAIPQEKQVHGCKIETQHEGNTIRWNMKCDNGSQGKGVVNYQWDSMQASVDMSMPEGHLTLTSKMTGKWSRADCTDGTNKQIN